MKYYTMENGNMAIDVKALSRDVRLCIAIPSYTGTKSEFSSSVTNLGEFLCVNKIRHFFHYRLGDSIGDLARCCCVAKFLSTDCTHLLFLDDDICFKYDEVLRLLAFDVDVVGGNYPKKRIFFEEMRNAIIAQPDFPGMPVDDALNLMVASSAQMTAKALDGGEHRDGFTEAKSLPGGFLLIKRGVFHRIIEKRPDLKFSLGNDDPLNEHLYAFFKHVIKNGEWLGEDYYFSDLCRECGITIWKDEKAIISHIGNHPFVGDPSK